MPLTSVCVSFSRLKKTHVPDFFTFSSPVNQLRPEDMFMCLVWRLVSFVPTAGLYGQVSRHPFCIRLDFLCLAICYDTKKSGKSRACGSVVIKPQPASCRTLSYRVFLRQAYACFCVASCSFTMSARDFDLVTSHTPRQTSMTASPWLGLNTPMPVSMLTVTDTSGCT